MKRTKSKSHQSLSDPMFRPKVVESKVRKEQLRSVPKNKILEEIAEYAKELQEQQTEVEVREESP